MGGEDRQALGAKKGKKKKQEAHQKRHKHGKSKKQTGMSEPEAENRPTKKSSDARLFWVQKMNGIAPEA